MELAGVKYKCGMVMVADRDMINIRQQSVKRGELVTLLSAQTKDRRVLIESQAGVVIANVPIIYLRAFKI